jgi:hypothetical protein
MNDLIERLRSASMATLTRQLCHEAADEIERLRTALQDIADCITHDYSRRDIQAITFAALEEDDE